MMSLISRVIIGLTLWALIGYEIYFWVHMRREGRDFDIRRVEFGVGQIPSISKDGDWSGEYAR